MERKRINKIEADIADIKYEILAILAHIKKTESKTEEPRLISCCERMNDAFRKGVVVMRGERIGHDVTYRLHFAQITEDSIIGYCPFCGEKIKLDKWWYL